MKITYVELAGKKYPLCFSIFAIKEISNQICPIDKLKKEFNTKKGVDARMINNIVKLSAILIKNGCEYCNTFKVEPYENAPVVDGVFTPLTFNEIMFITPKEKFNTLTQAVFNCVDDDQKKKIQTKQVENTKKKNYKGNRSSTLKQKQG